MSILSDSFSCSLFPICSGCDRINAIRIPPIFYELQEFFFQNGIEFEIASKNITNWRSRAKLAVRGKSTLPKIGLFSTGTHEVVDMCFCPHHYPVMNDALKLIRKKMVQFNIVPYQESGNKGRLKYIQMVGNRESSKIQLTLVWNSDDLWNGEKRFLQDLYSEEGIFHSLWNNFHPIPSNTIFGNVWELFLGEEDFWQKIGNIPFCLHPSCFSQAHLEMFEDVLKYISSSITTGSSILEFYAGVGCISTCISTEAIKVCMVESSRYAKSCFEKTISSFPNNEREKFSFIQSSVEECDLGGIQDIDTLIVDPPRKGLSASCKEKIDLVNPRQLFYVSCGPRSFMRDCEEFFHKGWKLKKAKGFLFFPGTDHLEIVAEFSNSLIF